jgi:hypothetical protein
MQLGSGPEPKRSYEMNILRIAGLALTVSVLTTVASSAAVVAVWPSNDHTVSLSDISTPLMQLADKGSGGGGGNSGGGNSGSGGNSGGGNSGGDDNGGDRGRGRGSDDSSADRSNDDRRRVNVSNDRRSVNETPRRRNRVRPVRPNSPNDDGTPDQGPGCCELPGAGGNDDGTPDQGRGDF